MLLPMQRPANDAELGKILTEAAATRTPIEVVGLGTKRALGRPMQSAVNLSTRAMRGVTLYEPTELVMSAKAGTPLSMIEKELAAKRQMLAFEPVDLGPLAGAEAGQGTIGAVFATNIGGARRVSAGAPRDHLIGMRAVNGLGEVFKSGGRVMKNVTGYDLARGLCGSWGTLAVMTEVTFKVLPMAETSRTMVFLGLPDAIAAEVMCAAMATPYEVSGAFHLQTPLVKKLRHTGLNAIGKSLTLLRIENFQSSVEYRAQRLTEVLAPYGRAEQLDGEETRLVWEELRQLSFLHASQNPVWRISTSPKAGPKVAAAITHYMDCHAAFDWSGGLVWAEVLPTMDAGAADIRRVVATHGGHATLMRAETSVRSGVEVFQPLESGVHKLQKRIKTTFDPAGILNPGRMYADL